MSSKSVRMAMTVSLGFHVMLFASLAARTVTTGFPTLGGLGRKPSSGLEWTLLNTSSSKSNAVEPSPSVAIDTETKNASYPVSETLPGSRQRDPESWSAFVQRGVQRHLETASEISTPEAQAKLNKLARQLTDISDAERTEKLSSRLADWLGAAPRRTDPSPVASRATFDFASAQIQDVIRREHEAKATTFVAVLVDRAGRTYRTPLPPDEGEQLFRTMALIQKYPLLEAVYRNVVMGLLDRLIGNTPSLKSATPMPKMHDSNG